ncbi:MAG: hypothetical protein B1H13_01310, partial [Desulfobacteraceae bacterium 4484_190.3]
VKTNFTGQNNAEIPIVNDKVIRFISQIFPLTQALACGMKKNSQGWVIIPQARKIASFFYGLDSIVSPLRF